MVMFNKKRYISKYNAYLKSINNYDFLNEIIYTKQNTKYKKMFELSSIFTKEYNYYFIFECDSGVEYILQFDYYQDKVGPFVGEHLYNISFTTYKQYLLSLKSKNELQEVETYEEITNNNEEIEIMKRLIYIFDDFHNEINTHKSIYVIGETNDERKINMYRDLIKNSIPNTKELKGKSSINNGKDVYYFTIKYKL